jgi:ribosome-associated translation inhibitor RaiA
MDLVVKSRGEKVSGRSRERLERKLGRLARLDPKLQWAELEVIREASRRVNGGHRVQAACGSARRTYRAVASGPDLEAAIGRVVGRLERQISQDHERRRSRMLGGANRVKSGRMSRHRPGTGPPSIG